MPFFSVIECVCVCLCGLDCFPSLYVHDQRSCKEAVFAVVDS